MKRYFINKYISTTHDNYELLVLDKPKKCLLYKNRNVVRLKGINWKRRTNVEEQYFCEKKRQKYHILKIHK